MRIKKLKDNTIYLPCTPSNWVSEPRYTQITRINLTSGGGMGGSRWTEYVTKTKSIIPNTIQRFTRINGKKVKLNTSYITDAEDFILVSVDFDNRNPNAYHLGLNTLQYIMDEDLGEVTLQGSYGETKTY